MQPGLCDGRDEVGTQELWPPRVSHPGLRGDPALRERPSPVALNDECLPDVTVGRKRRRRRWRKISMLVIIILLMMMGFTLGLVALGVPADAAGLLAAALVASTIQLVRWMTSGGPGTNGAAFSPLPDGGA